MRPTRFLPLETDWAQNKGMEHGEKYNLRFDNGFVGLVNQFGSSCKYISGVIYAVSYVNITLDDITYPR